MISYIFLQFWRFQQFWQFLILDNLDSDNDNETCGLWDIDYNSDNWEPEFMTIFGTWQLSVTLDSIRNSCDVSQEYPVHIGKQCINVFTLF